MRVRHSAVFDASQPLKLSIQLPVNSTYHSTRSTGLVTSAPSSSFLSLLLFLSWFQNGALRHAYVVLAMLLRPLLAYDIKQCYIATFTMLCSGWIRYAGTVSGVSGQGAYALLMIAQVSTSILNIFVSFS